jgi:nucleoside-diphosphate-sugar epimerase
MNTIVVLGASGYIGRRLVTDLAQAGNVRVKVLSRSPQRDRAAGAFPDGVEIVEGDLCDPGALMTLCEPACTVIHLAYLWEAGEAQNLTAIRNLTAACKVAGVKRLIHLSTAMVTGRTRNDRIAETEACRPRSEYATTKLKIEQIVINARDGGFDTAILRPTAVFGPGGENLKKLAQDLMAGKRVRNYLKSCLFGNRRMNLVHLSNVVAAIVFLSAKIENLGGEVFIVSDADVAANNFRDTERILMRELHIPDYRFPLLRVPQFVLMLFLVCLGKDNINPRSDYFSDKLAKLGFRRPVGFEAGLADYAAWYHAAHQSH